MDNEEKYNSDHVSNNHGITWQVLAHVAGGILLAIGAYFGSGLITKVQALEVSGAVTQSQFDHIIQRLNVIDTKLDRLEQKFSVSGASSNHGFSTTRR